MENFELEPFLARSRALDLAGIDFATIRTSPLPPGAIRTLRYMQDIESYTIVYLKSLLATRAIDDSEVATFLPCWLYEETFHGRALAKLLDAAGIEVTPRAFSQHSVSERIEMTATALVARAWPDFVAVHMTWGAINELTTLTGYRRLAEITGHPVLEELLARIMRDEARHFSFYYHQAERRLARPAAARVTRFLVDHFWAPVGSGVQPKEETRFLARYLFGGADGRAAARQIDERIRRLPGFSDVQLV